MKSNDLLDAIGEVSDEYVADAENVKKRRMPRQDGPARQQRALPLWQGLEVCC